MKNLTLSVLYVRICDVKQLVSFIWRNVRSICFSNTSVYFSDVIHTFHRRLYRSSFNLYQIQKI